MLCVRVLHNILFKYAKLAKCDGRIHRVASLVRTVVDCNRNQRANAAPFFFSLKRELPTAIWVVVVMIMMRGQKKWRFLVHTHAKKEPVIIGIIKLFSW